MLMIGIIAYFSVILTGLIVTMVLVSMREEPIFEKTGILTMLQEEEREYFNLLKMAKVVEKKHKIQIDNGITFIIENLKLPDKLKTKDKVKITYGEQLNVRRVQKISK